MHSRRTRERSASLTMLHDREQVVRLTLKDLRAQQEEGHSDPHPVPTQVSHIRDAVVRCDDMTEEVEDDVQPDEPPGRDHEDPDHEKEHKALDMLEDLCNNKFQSVLKL